MTRRTCADDIAEIITDGWVARAPKSLARKYLEND